MYKHILIPTDGSALSDYAIGHGVALAKALGAKVTGITVTAPFHVFSSDIDAVSDTPTSYTSRINEAASNYLGKVTDAAERAEVKCRVVAVEAEHPYQAIIDAATRNECDAIVMASHGRRGLAALVLGSETVKVLTHSSITVVVCRAPQSLGKG